jgi:PAS domain-containing protein
MPTPGCDGTTASRGCDLQLVDAHLVTARRVLSVAIFISSSGEAPPAIRAVLPSSADLISLLDAIGPPGSPEDAFEVDEAQANVLERAVFATLVLSMGDFEQATYAALYPTPDQPRVDPASFATIMSILSLAMHLSGADPQDRRGAPAGRARPVSPATPALGALADAIALPVWVSDVDFLVTWANPALCDLLGTTLEDLRGSSYAHWTDPDDVARIDEAAFAASAEQRNFSVQVGIGSGPGEYAPVVMMVAPRLSVTGELIGWAGMCFDASGDCPGAVRLETMASTSGVFGARVHLLLDQLPGVVWTVDRSLRLTSILGGGLRDLVDSDQQLVGSTLSEVFSTTDPNYPPIRAALAALAGESTRYRNQFRGRATQAVVEPLRDASGNTVGAIGLSIDITDQVARERRDARLVRQLELAQELGRLGSWEIDLTTGEGLWSDEGFRVLGLEPGSVPPTFESFISRVHPDDQARIRLLNSEGFRNGRGYTTTYRALLPDGRVRHIRAAVEFDRAPDGSVTRVYGILQDVSAADVSADAGTPTTPAPR